MLLFVEIQNVFFCNGTFTVTHTVKSSLSKINTIFRKYSYKITACNFKIPPNISRCLSEQNIVTAGMFIAS